MLENDLKKFSVSLMSNTKWTKFFTAINCDTMELEACKWKLVSEKEPINGWLPDSKQLGKNYVGDCGALNGPFLFKEIEWIMIPAKHGICPYDHAPLKYTYQDLKSVKEKISSAGNFEIEVCDEGIKVYGYKP
jgi:hypothetical protein